MAIRFKELVKQQEENTTERALRRAYEQLPLVAAARGGSSLGIAGETAIEPMPVWPVIDPVTGESEEPPTPTDYYRVGRGGALGALPLKR